MSSDRDDGRRHGGGADGTAGQGGEPSPGRGGPRLDELRARMRAIESEARRSASLRQDGASGNRLSGDQDHHRREPDARFGESDTAPDESDHHHADLFASPGSGKSHRGDAPGIGLKAAAALVQARTTPQAFPAPPQSSADPAPEDPAEDDYTPLFDQSLSGPSRRDRRRGASEQTATQRALGLLTRREHSRKELTRKLTSRGLDRDEVVAAVDRLTDAGWQNDTRFADSLVRSRAGNGYGPLHIRAELSLHGLDSEAVAQALDRYEGDWLDNARDLVRRRFGEGHHRDLALRRKAADLLMRRGFDGETARNANRSGPED